MHDTKGLLVDGQTAVPNKCTGYRYYTGGRGAGAGIGVTQVKKF